ncbi:dTDP-4-dehydrorhamnose reductase [Marinobacterium rhizophilum]|uniref:dTDP-4-dehydrorhamnose reductase n=1 Tax=Marinobacterium rhizophilum TaxID=420402 RepID=UPI00036B2796|nr:dTDP-4-dehydrorhamnose reductase [Marinobacterium rhizophilum]
MRVLITGAHGQVGAELMRLAPAGFDVRGLGSAQLDISDAVQVARTMHELQPQLIINAAAYTAVDKAENDSGRAYAVNRDGVGLLARAAEQSGIPLLHISTDYVFRGDSRAPYTEDDATAPSGVYGASKLAGEQALAEHCSRYITLRTSWVFGATGNNFVKTMLRLGTERPTLGVVADQRGGPTASASIARALWHMAQRYTVDGDLPWGIYHYSGAPACSWHDFAVAIFEQAQQLGLLATRPQISAITTADYPTPARRPANSVLDCSKLQHAFGIPQPDWRLDLHALLNALRST